jgi:hypothetical protein
MDASHTTPKCSVIAQHQSFYYLSWFLWARVWGKALLGGSGLVSPMVAVRGDQSRWDLVWHLIFAVDSELLHVASMGFLTALRPWVIQLIFFCSTGT